MTARKNRCRLVFGRVQFQLCHGQFFCRFGLGNFSFASKTNRHKKTGAKLYSILPLIYVKDGKVERVEILPLYVNNAESWKLNGKVLRPIDFTPQVLKGQWAQSMLESLVEWTEGVPGIAKSAASALKIKGERAIVQVRQ